MDREPLDFLVFISFASDDHESAWKICQALEARGLRCWVSLRDLETGSRYGDEIIRQIRSSDALVLVLSKAAGASEFVHRELERAVSYRIPIFSVRTEEVLPGAALELFVSATQWIDLWAGDFNTQLDRLADDIRKRRRRTEPDVAVAQSPSTGASARSPTRAAVESVPSGASGFRRYIGLLIAAAAVAVFGILNLSRGAMTRPIDFALDSATDSVDRSQDETAASPPVEPPLVIDTAATSVPDPIIVRNGAGDAPERGPADPESSDDSADVADRPPAEGILVAVYGDAGAGAETVETILLGELSDRGHSAMDRVSLDPTSAASEVPISAEQLGRLRDESGVALVVLADLRTEATRSVGDLYTGRATLSVRTYNTETRRLIDTQIFQVGAGNTPGKIGASALAASHEAVTQVAHQAAIALARELRQVAKR